MTALAGSSLREAVRAAAGRADVAAAMGRVYADIQAAVDARRPVCVASGRCCRFEEFGHRLYVSTLELAAFVAGARPGAARGGGPAKGLSLFTQAHPPLPMFPTSPGGCPFQRDNLCSVHTIRPFGCRMFFCDATSTEWQNEAYERFHARIKALHETLGVPYFYVEWRAGLAAIGLAGTSGSGGMSASD